MTSLATRSPFSWRDFIRSFMLLELFKGMALTGKYMFARKITVQFPEEKTPMSPRFRGLHALRRYPNGEERYLTVRDRGPQKKLARDMVDSRFTVGELLLPVVFVAVILNTVNNDVVNLAAILIMWSIMGGMIVDAVLLSRKVTKRLTSKYGEANLERGLKMYVALRSMQMRPMRLPKPQVKRGTVI